MIRRIGHAIAVALCLSATIARAQAPSADAFTPVVMGPMATTTAPFRADDGLFYVVYELWLTNAKAAPATIERIEVLDAANPSRVVHTLAGPELVRRIALLNTRPAESPVLGPNESRVIFVEVTFNDERAIPTALAHRFVGTGAANPAAQAATPVSYVVGPWPIRRFRPPVIGAPLRGPGWVAFNSCCQPGTHRSAVQSVNGDLVNSQRFAIDWMRLDAQGRFVAGDPARPENWASYDQPILAVADGRVVAMRNDLDDQVPGRLPDPATITMETVDGNYVVLDIGNGLYVFYAHMRKGSVRVRVGQRVRAGQEIGRLGNTGNTSAPHLHLHIMQGPSPLGANGVPYVFRAFTLRGAVDAARFAASDDLAGTWLSGMGSDARSRPARHVNQLPLNLRIVDWPQ